MTPPTKEEREDTRVSETSRNPGEPTLSDVQFREVTSDLVAECRGIWGGPPGKRMQQWDCLWPYPRPQPGVGWSAVRDQARQHALDNPGHEVTVTRYEVTTYWLPVPDPTEIQTEGGSDDA